jgi:hypothetical protein
MLSFGGYPQETDASANANKEVIITQVLMTQMFLQFMNYIL